MHHRLYVTSSYKLSDLRNENEPTLVYEYGTIYLLHSFLVNSV